MPSPYSISGYDVKTGPPSLGDEVTCSYDVIIAIDLDCMNEREQPSIKQFAYQFIEDILSNVQHIEGGYVRVGVIGFHSEIIIGMNLYVMSFEQGREKARSKILRDNSFTHL